MSKLRQMEVFVAVVEAGSFADAASEVGMSAVMVGRHIQGLEKTLNTQLIKRTTRRQSITGEGRLFYEEAKLALEQVNYAFSRVEASSPEPGAQRPAAHHRADESRRFPGRAAGVRIHAALSADPGRADFEQ